MDLTGMLQAAAGNVGGGTPWELTNATFNGTPWNKRVFSEMTISAGDLFFKPDGTKLYLIDSGNGANSFVYEYDLSVAWDITKTSYVQNLSVFSQEAFPSGLFFKPDGTKMYIVGSGDDEINEYSLSTAWDISSASHTTAFSVSGQDTDPRGLFFKPDGTKMYVVGNTGDDINEYSLSTAWDISSASYVQNFSIASQDTNLQGLFFKSDGTKMYVMGNGTDAVLEYSLSTAWDISSASYVQNFSVASQEGVPIGLSFKDDGTKMYVFGSDPKAMHSYDLSSAWDISTASYGFPPTTDYFSVATQETGPNGIFFKPDGTKMYVTGSVGDDVNEYDLSSAWDISTASYVQAFSVASQDATPEGLFFKDDGTKMYVIGRSSDAVHEYSLSTAWNVSTASFSQSFSVASQDVLPRDLFFKTDGTKMYVMGDATDNVLEYSLSSAWDISTASYVQSFSVSGQDTSALGLSFKSDGNKMYMVGSLYDFVNEYDLSTAWDISTASYVQRFFIGSYESSPQALAFKDDGTKMYVIGSASDAVWSFDL